MRLAIVSLVALTACGRYSFAPSVGDSGVDDSGDGSRDGALDTPDGPVVPDLLAYYPLDELATGNVLVDATGHGFNLTCTATTCPTKVTGIRGTAMKFDGVDDVAIAGTANFGSLPAFTVAAWINLASPGTSRCVVAKQLVGTSFQSFVLWVDTTDYVRYGVNSSNGNSVDVQNPGPTANAWHHFAGTWTGTVMTMWVDGSVSNMGPATADFDASPLRVGACINFDMTLASPFAGGIDDLRIYSRALDAAEITALATP